MEAIEREVVTVRGQLAGVTHERDDAVAMCEEMDRNQTALEKRLAAAVKGSDAAVAIQRELAGLTDDVRLLEVSNRRLEEEKGQLVEEQVGREAELSTLYEDKVCRQGAPVCGRVPTLY